MKREGKTYALYVRLPFAEKEQDPGLDQGGRARDPGGQSETSSHAAAHPRVAAACCGAAFADQRLRVVFGEKEAHASR